MARQKSEDPVVPEGRRKPSPIVLSGRGGKEVPVDQVMEQLGLPLATAVNPRGAPRARPADRSARPSPTGVPKASVLNEKSPSTAMEKISSLQGRP